MIERIHGLLADLDHSNTSIRPNPFRPWEDRDRVHRILRDSPSLPCIPGYPPRYLKARLAHLSRTSGAPDPCPWDEELAVRHAAPSPQETLAIDWLSPSLSESWRLTPFSRDDVRDLLDYNGITFDSGLDQRVWLKTGGWPELLGGLLGFLKDRGEQRLRDDHLMAEWPPWTSGLPACNPDAIHPMDRRGWFLELPRILPMSSSLPWQGDRDEMLLLMMEWRGSELLPDYEQSLRFWVVAGWIRQDPGTRRLLVPTADSWVYWLVQQDLLRRAAP